VQVLREVMGKLREYLLEMKIGRHLFNEDTSFFEMANLGTDKSGLLRRVWVEQGGKYRNKSDSEPRIKIQRDTKKSWVPGEEISVSIRTGEILSKGSRLKADFDALSADEWRAIRTWIKENQEDLMLLWDDEIDEDEFKSRSGYKQKGNYQVTCPQCGFVIKRQIKSPIIKNPNGRECDRCNQIMKGAKPGV
jgi:hypothetical protein